MLQCGYFGKSAGLPTTAINSAFIEQSRFDPQIKSFPASPQHLCSMCYRLCEMIESFRERCQETEKKLMRAKLKRRSATKVAVAASAAPRPPIKAEREVAEAGEVEGNELQEEVDTHYGAVEYDAPIAEAGGGNEEVDHEETCDPTQIDIQWDDYGKLTAKVKRQFRLDSVTR